MNNTNNLPTIQGERYDYHKAMYEDIRNAIEELGGLDAIENKMDSCYSEVEEYLNDELWTWDSVTGNGSGSYWFNSYKAQCALIGNLDLLGDAIREFETDASKLCRDPESADVTIRCYMLYQIIGEVVADLRNEQENETEMDAQIELAEVAKPTTEQTKLA